MQFQKIFIPPIEGIFALDPTPNPLEFKNAVAPYYYAKADCSCGRERKNIVIHDNTASNNLNFTLQRSSFSYFSVGGVEFFWNYTIASKTGTNVCGGDRDGHA